MTPTAFAGFAEMRYKKFEFKITWISPILIFVGLGNVVELCS